eukprot:1161676-Pelagomonas_calceolata.AAC.9
MAQTLVNKTQQGYPPAATAPFSSLMLLFQSAAAVCSQRKQENTQKQHQATIKFHGALALFSGLALCTCSCFYLMLKKRLPDVASPAWSWPCKNVKL